MGIRGLTQLANGLKTKKKIPLGHISHERHKVWAIDASLFLYRARCLSANHSSDTAFGRSHRRPHRFRNVVGDVPLEKSHLVGIIDVVSQLLANCITPVIIFDGPPPREKIDTLKKRKSHKEHAQQNIAWIEQHFEPDPPPLPSTPVTIASSSTNNPISDDFFERAFERVRSPVPLTHQEKQKIKQELEIEKQKLAAVFLQPHHFYQTQSLCQILGIPYICSPGEAEVTCVELLRNKQIDAIYTADSDVLVFGCTRMVRRIINDEYIDALDHNFVIKELGVTHEQFVCTCILMGCDFCEAIFQQNAFHQALELVKQQPHPFDPVRFLHSLHNKEIEWRDKALRAFEIYTQPNPHVLHCKPIPAPNVPNDAERILHELRTHLDMNGHYVQRVVEQIMNSFEVYNQTSRSTSAIALGPHVQAGYVPYISNKKKRQTTLPPPFCSTETLVELVSYLTEASHGSPPSTWWWTETAANAHTWNPPFEQTWMQTHPHTQWTATR